jgi:UV excision repair protein RAD23
MKIIIKNLKQIEYIVEIESDQKTVKDLKDEIQKVHGFDSNLMKLLHNGVILNDTNTLADYKIKDENVIIMMNSKPKQKPNPPQTNPQPSQEPKAPTEPKAKEPEKKPEETKPDMSEKVNALVEMGYEREKVEKALTASGGSTDLAIEFLTSGNIPEHAPQSQPIPNIPNNNNDSNLDEELRINASLIKLMCARDPNKIISILNSMKEKTPHLLTKIRQHEEDFKRLLVSPINQEDLDNFRIFEQRIGPGRRPPELRLTREETEAIKRLKDLGNFSQAEVIQAYFACDKNEELTANYLFEQKLREEEEGSRNNNNQNQGQGQGQ